MLTMYDFGGYNIPGVPNHHSKFAAMIPKILLLYFLVFSKLSELPAYADTSDSSLENPVAMGFSSALLVVGVIGIYFLPLVIGIAKQKENVTSISVLNLFLGWTVIGWLVSLLWALTNSGSKRLNKDVAPVLLITYVGVFSLGFGFRWISNSLSGYPKNEPIGTITPSSALSSDHSSDQPKIGDHGTIIRKAVFGTTQANLEQIIKASLNNDAYGVKNMESLGQAGLLDPGTRVHVIGGGTFASGTREIRILSGPYAGRSCFVGFEDIGKDTSSESDPSSAVSKGASYFPSGSSDSTESTAFGESTIGGQSSMTYQTSAANYSSSSASRYSEENANQGFPKNDKALQENTRLVSQINLLQQRNSLAQASIRNLEKQLDDLKRLSESQEATIQQLENNLKIAAQISTTKEQAVEDMRETLERWKATEGAISETQQSTPSSGMRSAQTRDFVGNWPNVRDFLPLHYKSDIEHRLKRETLNRRLAAFGKSVSVQLKFSIEKDGHPTNIQITTPIDDPELKKRCFQYIEAAGPFRPLLSDDLTTLTVEADLSQPAHESLRVASVEIKALGNRL